MAHTQLLIDCDVGETRVALIEQGILSEFYIERRGERSPVGNIYLGKVTRVLPGMQAAFVDIGLDRAAFLHVEDLIDSKKVEKLTGDGGESKSGRGKKSSNRLTRKTPIRDVLKEGQRLSVQVSKGPIGTKGARVTSHVSLPGRYAVYLPTVDHVGVSKRIGTDQERKRLRDAIASMKPENGGVIVRTVAKGLTKKKLKADIGYLVNVWEKTKERLDKQKSAPAVLYEELDLVLRVARDLFNDEVSKIVINDESQYKRLREFLELFLPERADDVTLYQGQEHLFDEYGIEEELARAVSRKVPLASGGYLIIDRAEALTAIDVNTGRFTGRGKTVEETILQTNLEAVEEIAYQLRLRNIGGLIVLDFIDMEKGSHREKVFRKLREVLKNDKAKTTTVRISELGLVEMTRKRTHESLSRTLYEPCFYCDGTGTVKSKQTICHEILRQIGRERDGLPGYQIVVSAHPAVVDNLQREEAETLERAAQKYQRRIVLNARREYHMEQFSLTGV